MQLKKDFTSIGGLKEAFTRSFLPDYQFGQEVKINEHFTDYQLKSTNNMEDKQHEAGFDALMTGALWFKLQSVINHPIKREFPGVEAILSNNFSDVCDKNKIPMASIRASLDLQ